MRSWVLLVLLLQASLLLAQQSGELIFFSLFTYTFMRSLHVLIKPPTRESEFSHLSPSEFIA
jgi:hypothetical protein